MLDATGLTPCLLELEVTEDILLLDEERVRDTFQRIQELGVRVVFDDFGTGYASLSYLKKFRSMGSRSTGRSCSNDVPIPTMRRLSARPSVSARSWACG